MEKKLTKSARGNALDEAVVATQALAFLAADPARLRRFLDLTGLDPGTLRTVAASPSFATAVLTHLCDDERLLLDFASEARLDPEAIGRIVRGRAEAQHWDGA